jgi:transglutaminase-like putative cysteine protease
MLAAIGRISDEGCGMNHALRSLTLPLIALVALNLLPSVTLRPIWFVVVSTVFLAFRTWLELSHRKMPPRWTQWVVQAAVGVAVWQHYHSLFGDEAAGTWLSLLTVLKLFELRTKRDYFITALLCFMVLMSALLIDQSLLFSIFLFVDAFLILGFMYALEDERWSWHELKRIALRPLGLMGRVIPLLVLIFVLFPRFSTGFGTGTSQESKMGITDRLRPGSVSNLASSDELVFRAKFLNGEVPPRQALYWRGAILSLSSGLSWDRLDTEELRRAPMASQRQEGVEIYLETGFDKFLFTTESTLAIYLPQDLYGTRVGLRRGRVFELTQPLQTRERYYLEQVEGAVPETDNLEPYLKVSEKPSREVKELLEPLQGRGIGEKLNGVLDYFQKQNFAYSLQPPTVNSMDEFLFKTKVGFCEHFAGTTATLLRYLGVPSRVVVGFQGGAPSFLDSYVSVRAHDAHAWIEYHDGTRWRRADPTAAIAPAILTGNSEIGRQWMPSWVPSSWASTYLKTRAMMDEVEANWIGFLIRFDLAKQKELLAKLGMEAVLFRALPVFLVLAIALVLAVLYFIEAQGREHLTTEELLYRKFIRALKPYKLDKLPNEGPLTLMARIENANAKLAERARPILAALIEARYGSTVLSRAQASEISGQIRSLTKL